jgi:Domain of unknown function (DUF4278)
MSLIYRGQAFQYSPSTLVAPINKTGLIHTLFYRGSVYRCQSALQPTRLPKAINWRFSKAVEGQPQSLTPAH